MMYTFTIVLATVEVLLSTLVLLLLPITFIAYAGTDHGLPMTHIPYRYSTYFFILAIVIGNWYYMVQASRHLPPRK